MNLCACMGPHIDPSIGANDPYCLCEMRSRNLTPFIDTPAGIEYTKQAKIRLEEALKQYIQSNEEVN